MVAASLTACGSTGLPLAAQEETVNVWKAAATGNLEALKQHLAAGTNVNTKVPVIGLTPLMTASITGNSEAAEYLLAEGAKPNLVNKDGSTALHMASFFGHLEIVKALLAQEADVNVRNDRSETPLDTVRGAWSEDLRGVYQSIGETLTLELDLEKIKSARPDIAALLAERASKSGTQDMDTGYRGSYFVNGEIHVNTYGTPEGKPLTTGHSDFKPSWSKTGDMLVFFRRLKNDPVVTNWKTAICIINVDGTGFQQLTDGTHTDFNQTWTRDGSEHAHLEPQEHGDRRLLRDAKQGGQQPRSGGRPHRQEIPHVGLHMPHGRPDSRAVRTPRARLRLFLDDSPCRRRASLRTH